MAAVSAEAVDVILRDGRTLRLRPQRRGARTRSSSSFASEQASREQLLDNAGRRASDEDRGASRDLSHERLAEVSSWARRLDQHGYDVTTTSLQAELDALAYSGRRVRRVLAPSSVWCVRDRVDMEARTARQLRLPPGATLDVVPICQRNAELKPSRWPTARRTTSGSALPQIELSRTRCCTY
jgi:hypothetical protein